MRSALFFLGLKNVAKVEAVKLNCTSLLQLSQSCAPSLTKEFAVRVHFCNFENVNQ